MREVREGGVKGGKEVQLRRGLEGACSTGFWEGKCGTKREVRGNKGNAGGKGSTGMWNETQSKPKHKMQTDAADATKSKHK